MLKRGMASVVILWTCSQPPRSLTNELTELMRALEQADALAAAIGVPALLRTVEAPGIDDEIRNPLESTMNKVE